MAQLSGLFALLALALGLNPITASKEQHSCQEWNIPPIPENGEVFSIEEGVAVTYLCDKSEGYVRGNYDVILCDPRTRQWKPDHQPCEKYGKDNCVASFAPKTPQNAVIASYEAGDHITYRCMPQYVAKKSSAGKFTCCINEDGTKVWTGQLPQCEFFGTSTRVSQDALSNSMGKRPVLSCAISDLSRFEINERNSDCLLPSLETSDRNLYIISYRMFEYVQYGCKGGFDVEWPRENMLCNKVPGVGDTWSSPIQCHQNGTENKYHIATIAADYGDCTMAKAPKPPSNGRIASWKEGRYIHYSCKHGYRMKGSSTVICEKSYMGRRWDYLFSQCVLKDVGNCTQENAPPAPANGTIKTLVEGEFITYTCLPGYMTTSDDFLQVYKALPWTVPCSNTKTRRWEEEYYENYQCVPGFGACTAANAPSPPVNGRIESLIEGHNISYSCVHGYKMTSSGTAILECKGTEGRRIWTGRLSECVANDNANIGDCSQANAPSAPENGLVVSVIEGQHIIYTCRTDYIMKSTGMMTSPAFVKCETVSGKKLWSNLDGECVLNVIFDIHGCTKANAPPAPHNGHIQSVIERHSVIYACSPGYEMTSSYTAKCVTHQNKLFWTDPIGKCVPNDTDVGGCTARNAPLAPLNGYIASIEEGLDVVFSCMPGYVLTSPDPVICETVNGRKIWTGSVNQCVAADNGDCTRENAPLPPFNGFINTIVEGNYIGYTCKSGYSLTSSGVVRCETVSGRKIWSNTNATCINDKNSGCTVGNAPLPPPNGYIHSVQEGQFINFACNTGYAMTSVNSVKCYFVLGTKAWENRTVECKAIGDCTRENAPSKPVNGHMVTVEEGRRVKYICMPGYEPTSYGYVMCETINGSRAWNDTNIECLPRLPECSREDAPAAPKGGKLLSVQPGVAAIYQCNGQKNLGPSNIDVIHCTRADDFWSRNPPCMPNYDVCAKPDNSSEDSGDAKTINGGHRAKTTDGDNGVKTMNEVNGA